MYVKSLKIVKPKIINAGKINSSGLITYQILFVMNCSWIIDALQLPPVIVRAEIIIPIILSLINIKRIVCFIKKELLFTIFLFIYIANMLMGWVVNGFNPIYVIWNSFSNYIYFFFFVSCCVSMKKIDTIRILELMSKLHILNIMLCLYQYFVLGLYSDYLGGLFGIRQGCNGAQNIYAIIVCCYQMYKFMQGGKISKLLYYLSTFVIIAALADIMGFFVEISICLLLMLFNLPKASKKIKVIAVAGCAVLVGVELFKWFYPIRFEYFMKIQNWVKYIGVGNDTMGGIYGISRTNPFSQVNKVMFNNDIIKKIFGLGYGNAVFSDSMQMFQSPFYLKLQNYKYNWFTTSYTYVESGLFGIISYALLLIYFARNSFKLKTIKEDKNYGIMGIMLTVSYLFLFFYNQSLMVTPAYMIYLALASIFVFYRCDKTSMRLYVI